MARNRAVATAPGAEKLYVPFTPQEESARDVEEALPPPPLPTSKERVDSVFNGTDTNTIMLKTLFAQHNRILVLEGKSKITVSKFLILFEGHLS